MQKGVMNFDSVWKDTPGIVLKVSKKKSMAMSDRK